MSNVGFLSKLTASGGPMGYSSSTALDDDFALRSVSTVAGIAAGVLAVFFVFVYFFGLLAAVIEMGVIVFILLIAGPSVSEPYFQDLVIELMTVNLLVALFVLADYSGPLPAIKGIGITILILLAVGLLIFQIWKDW